MSKQFNDEEIIKLYQQGNDELPPKALDDAILAHASDAISKEQPVIIINMNNKEYYFKTVFNY